MNDTITLVRHAMGGLKDSQGVPMADHCKRVAEHFEHGTDAWIVGWLHDIIEDTNVDAEYLESLGYPAHIIEAVELLTHDKKQMDYPTYIDRICQSGNKLAITVKIADQNDNLNPKRWVGMSKYKAQALQKKWAGVREKLQASL